MKHQILFNNTLSKKKELFNSKNPGAISMYVCGITPYDYSHIGHGRTYINFDLLYRLLNFLSYDVIYVRNITDIDDKLLNKATEQGDIKKYKEIANFFYQDFQTQLQILNCLPPTIEPRATESIDTIIELIRSLMKKGHAYQQGLDIYFDISSDHDYGKLSKRKQEDLLSGARVEVNLSKKNPGDFVLWKGNDKQEFWQADWGYGRPGWHIECSAMISQHMTLPIDIHGGGIDLIFPHHENEIAQSESSTESELARFWLHNEFININKEKMSKSLNNTIKLKDLAQSCHPIAFRFYILQHHYKTPIDFSYEGVTSAGTALKRLHTMLKPALEKTATEKQNFESHPIAIKVIEALCDDLNSPKALGIIFEHQKQIQENEKLALCIAEITQSIFGISFDTLEKKITAEIEKLIVEREQARIEKNWNKADELRTKLQKLGYDVHDKKL